MLAPNRVRGWSNTYRVREGSEQRALFPHFLSTTVREVCCLSKKTGGCDSFKHFQFIFHVKVNIVTVLCLITSNGRKLYFELICYMLHRCKQHSGCGQTVVMIVKLCVLNQCMIVSVKNLIMTFSITSALTYYVCK